MKIKDVITFDGQGKPLFPTLTACAVCHGYTGFYTHLLGGQVNDKQLAVQIKLVQLGYWLRSTEGRNMGGRGIYPEPCSCECDHRWKTRKIGNCLHEWECEAGCGKKITVDSSD